MVIIMLGILLMACSNKEAAKGALVAPAAAPLAAGVQKTLAYEHSIQLDTAESNISKIYNAAISACAGAIQDECVLLESRIHSGRGGSANLKFRAKPNGIRQIIDLMRSQAEMTQQSSSAEDLAAPIADAEKRLAMLKDYRSKLKALESRATNDVDALIKVSRELAQVQSDIETLAGTHSGLMRRVETETLTVTMISLEQRSFWSPISSAFSSFGGNLSQGIASLMTGLAYLLPWLIAIGFGTYMGRQLWMRRRRGA
jgi:hypothetical protein